MATFRHTGVADGVARTDYASLGQSQDGKINWVAAGGTGDAIAATYVPAITALVDGQFCFVRAGAANTLTNPTFAPNGLTAHTITKIGGTALLAGDIFGANHELILRYNLANTRWELYNPAGSTFNAATFNGLATFNAGATLVSTDAGAAQAPTLDLFRDSASPAASDVLAGIDFNGRDSAANKQLYARIVSVIQDVTSTTEDAALFLQAVVAGAITTVLQSNGADIVIPGNLGVTGNITGKNPTVQRLTSGSSATYTPSTGVVRIKVRMVGGGGGGGASTANTGGTGGTTTFGSWTAVGGSGGAPSAGAGGAGGTGGATGTGTLVQRLVGTTGRGGQGSTTSVTSRGGQGGLSPFLGAGDGGLNSAGVAAVANSGSGGGGGATAAATGGGGGGAGEYLEFWVSAPGATTYTITAGGTGASAGGQAGADGGSGVILIEEFYS